MLSYQFSNICSICQPDKSSSHFQPPHIFYPERCLLLVSASDWDEQVLIVVSRTTSRKSVEVDISLQLVVDIRNKIGKNPSYPLLWSGFCFSLCLTLYQAMIFNRHLNFCKMLIHLITVFRKAVDFNTLLLAVSKGSVSYFSLLWKCNITGPQNSEFINQSWFLLPFRFRVWALHRFWSEVEH